MWVGLLWITNYKSGSMMFLAFGLYPFGLLNKWFLIFFLFGISSVVLLDLVVTLYIIICIECNLFVNTII